MSFRETVTERGSRGNRAVTRGTGRGEGRRYLAGMVGLSVFLVLAGPAVGSFLAAVADRLPRGEDVLLRRSACRSCGARLRWHALLPVLSFLALRGRCRVCGAAIPRRLLEAELAGLGLGVAAVALAGGPAQAVVAALFLWCLLGLALCDMAALRLPDALTLVLVLAGLGLAALDPGRGLPAGLLAGAAGAGAFLALRLGYRVLRGREGLGLGDVKLMAGIGAGLGLMALPLVALLASGAALALAGLARARGGPAPARDAVLPFGAYLAAAAAALWMLAAGHLLPLTG